MSLKQMSFTNPSEQLLVEGSASVSVARWGIWISIRCLNSVGSLRLLVQHVDCVRPLLAEAVEAAAAEAWPRTEQRE